MSCQIALLRAINVGGHNLIAMSDLRKLCEALGLTEAKTLLQSGNLVFKCDRHTGAALESLLEKETAKRLGVTPDYLVRSAAELQQVVDRNPFPKAAKDDPGHLLVLKAAPPASHVDALRAAIKGRETIQSDGKQLYIIYPDGVGRSKLTGTLIEKKLDTRGTARNWNTVLKLLKCCE
jgi:uncharacterized protein (DUF1697 family)